MLLPGQPIPPAGELVFQEDAMELGAGQTLDFPVWAGHDGPDQDLVGLEIDITALAPSAVQEPRLLLDFPLDGNANDNSGRGHTATVHGGPQPAASGERKALRFSGKGDWIDTGTNLAELKKEFTIEVWVKPDAVQPVNANIFGNHTNDGKGLLLQMDGSNMNRWAFVMGIGGGRWGFTKPIRFTPDVWQHVAIVKSLREIKFYLNGVLLDTVDAPYAHLPSPMNFAVGLGFEDASRCFRGELAGLRVWDRALPEIKPEVTPGQQFQALISNASVKLETAGRSRIFPADKTPVINVLYADTGKLPADAEITASFEGSDYAGNPIAIPTVKLSAANQFQAKLELPLPAGFYRLVCKPTATGPAGAVELPPVSLAFSVLSGSTAEALPASRPAESPIGSKPTHVTSLDGEDWLIATDPGNIGREQGWYNAPQPDAKLTKVPWIIQDIFNNYHGVVWYWRDFNAHVNPDESGRYILKFLGVDYLAEVWLNGQRIGSHEGAEAPFEFDVTSVIKPGAENRLAVRVLNPTNEPIDGIALNTTARGPRAYPVQPGSVYNTGGITDSVELLATPAVRLEDVYAKPDWKTGRVRIEANARNASDKPVQTLARFAITPAKASTLADSAAISLELPPGDTKVIADLAVKDWQLWSPESPALYQVTSEVGVKNSEFYDVRKTRIGFRDFRYENNAF
ncbi:MAG: LamG-like jellyroll fold domain-containing protein, partial [Chthoniobacterales bacterium]